VALLELSSSFVARLLGQNRVGFAVSDHQNIEHFEELEVAVFVALPLIQAYHWRVLSQTFDALVKHDQTENKVSKSPLLANPLAP